MGHPTLFLVPAFFIRVFLIRIEGNDPDVRGFGVGFEIYVDHAKDYPLTVGRDFGRAHALELHHVFEGEGMLGLGCGGYCECDQSKGENEAAHEGSSDKRDSVAE
jgi:hypothetical protein